MTAQDWLALSDKRPIRNRIACDPYSMAYPALLSHFSGLHTLNWDAAVLGLHIVYGWMPTIPKLGGIMQWNAAKRREVVTALNSARSGQVPSDIELEIIKAFCNNSVIGASKLLHFLRPRKFPIWDTRVAKVFLRNPKARWEQANEIKRWKDYRSATTRWLSDRAVKDKCSELRQLASFLSHVASLRLVELVMFHKTTSNR